MNGSMKRFSIRGFLAVITSFAICAGGMICLADQNFSALPSGFQFDGKISRTVLENFLSRSICVEGLLNGKGHLADESLFCGS